MKQALPRYCLLFAAVWMTACASTASGKKQSTFSSSRGSQSPATLKKTAPKGALYAVIRYPAVVETSAKDKYREAYLASPIGGKMSPGGASIEAESLADATIVKSNYFALSLYKELAARLPEHTVLLSPHRVLLDADGSLTSEPITQAESLPSVTTIDFATYSFPDMKKMMGKNPLTFGDLVTPLVTVRTDPRADAPTKGIKLASANLAKYAIGSADTSISDSVTALQSGRFDESVPELDFIAYLSKDATGTAPMGNLSVKRGDHIVQSYPIEKIKMPKAEMKKLSADPSNTAIDPLETAFSDGFADRIVAIILDTPVEKAAMYKRAAAINEYDPSLAALTFGGSDAADYQSRYNYAIRLLDAERKYLSVQSLRLFDGVQNGEMGAQVRDMLKTEYNILEKRRRMAQQQNAATALAVLAVVATGVTIANSGGTSKSCDASGNCINFPTGPSLGEYILADLLLNGAIMAAQTARAYNKGSAQIGENYLSSIVPALDLQTNIQVDMIDSNETITAVRFDDLKSKLKTLYAQKQRGLETVASRCGFTPTQAGGQVGAMGSWMGACNGGVASGPGAGAAKLADGTVVEYYGQAQGGKPHGAGYMIIHKAGTAQALEGNFTNGQPDGAVRVAKPGKPDSVRQYKAGVDSGSASASSVVSPFTPRPVLQNGVQSPAGTIGGSL